MSWRERILGESVELLTDGSHNPPPAKEAGIPMLSARNVSTSGIDLDPGYRLVSEEDYLEEAKRAEPQSGDVLLTIVGTIGRTTVVRKQSLPFVLQRSVALLRPTRDLLPEYLSYWLESPDIQHFLLSNARGTAQKGVYLKTLRSVPISYPSLDAQKEICAKLDLQLSRHASCVWQLKQIKAKLKQARASILKAAVEGRLGKSTIKGEFEHRKVGNLFDHRLGKMLDKAKNTGRLTPYLRNANVRWQSFDFADIKTIQIDIDEISDVSTEQGDIIVCEGGEPGRCAVWNRVESMVIQKALHRLRPKEPLNSAFFSYQIESSIKSGRMEDLMTGSTIKHLTGKMLRQAVLAVPALEVQNQIVSEIHRRFSVLDQVEATVTASLARCGKLRQAILKQAFEGRLVPVA